MTIPLWYRASSPAWPPVHALVIATSSYPHRPFGLTDLPGAARSGYDFACWLRDHFRPERGQLASIRLLLAPLAGDPTIPDDPAIIQPTGDNVLAALGEWSADCRGPSGVPILALAGHGLQAGDGDGVVFVHDAGLQSADPLREAIDITAIRRALYGPQAPPTQWFFVDMCRTPNSELENCGDVGGGIRLHPRGRAAPRHAPIFCSTRPGRESWQSSSGTIFYRALQDCLTMHAVQFDHDAGWRVTAAGLGQALALRVQELATAANVDQASTIGGCFDGSAVFTTAAEPPHVPFRVDVQPTGPDVTCGAALMDHEFDAVIMERRLAPVCERVRAGVWQLEVTLDRPDDSPYRNPPPLPVSVLPPEGVKTVTLRPRGQERR